MKTAAPRWRKLSFVGNGGGNFGEPRTIIVIAVVAGPMACNGIARSNQKLKKKGEGSIRREAKKIRIHSPTVAITSNACTTNSGLYRLPEQQPDIR